MRTLALLAGLCASLAAQEALEFRVPFPDGNLGYYAVPAGDTAQPVPLLVVAPPGLERSGAKAVLDEWRESAAGRRWALAVPYGKASGSGAANDGTVRLLEALVGDAKGRLNADPARVYLAAAEVTVPVAFYTASRVPGLFAAAAAFGGEPRAAIETNRLFGGNTALTPVLWVIPSGAAEPFLRKLRAAEFRVVAGPPERYTREAALDWLAQWRMDRYPLKLDLETGNLGFARCFWVEITRFDPGQRNDVLPVGRVSPGSGAYLALGNFGYDAGAPGPGVVVSWLPADYRGPLRLNDRIMAVAGRPVQGPADYAALMDQMGEERAVAVMVERGSQRQRLETRVLLPKREETWTARLQAEWLPDAGEILVITRGVGAFRLDLPAQWLPARINWNGQDLGSAATAGCWEAGGGTGIERCPVKAP